MALRRELHRRGMRYRVQTPPLPGVRYRPDIVFAPARICVELMGCRWHRCPQCAIADPVTNAEYWKAKLDGNVRRDRRNAAALAAAGWTLIIVWEHETPLDGADRVQAALRRARADPF